MEKYITPELEIIEVETIDIITTSTGTETPRYDESDGIWDLNINP